MAWNQRQVVVPLLLCWMLWLIGVNQSAAETASRPITTKKRALTLQTMNPKLRRMEYAVRGEVVRTADRMSGDLSQYPFDRIVYTNIGNPQSVGQPCLTWPRQVLALCLLPDQCGIHHPHAHDLFPSDALARAKQYKQFLGMGNTGAYSHSQGIFALRQQVAEFIQARDDAPCDPHHLFLTNGASQGIQMILQTLIADSSVGVMLPIPQYPIYSATVDLCNGQKVGYYLDESRNWELNLAELERSLEEATENGVTVNSLVVINPGNPTGQVLSRQNVQDLVRFCVDHKLVLLADEVYQENVYQGEFYSCKRAAAELGLLDELELISFHSISKGVYGECGMRGGYMELSGIDPQVFDQIYKLASSSLCSTVTGQLLTAIMCHPPQPGDESYQSHQAEMQTIYQNLKEKAALVSTGLNSIPGISCQPCSGSMYCFPSIQLPQSVLDVARDTKTSPDTIYCVDLLKHTGICVVPASGFGTIPTHPPRFGFRTTFLPERTELQRCVTLIREHYRDFCQRYQ